MIALRRLLAVALVVVLVLAFLVSLISSRVTATLMQPHFYAQQLDAADAYQVFDQQVLPEAVHSFLVDQRAKLPANLAGVTLPTDPASEQAIVDLLRLALPPAALRAQTDAALDQVVPYLSGRTAHFDVRIHLGDELRAVAGHPPGQPSALQRTWDQLDLADRTVRGLVEQYAASQGASATTSQVLAAVAAGKVSGVNTWLETQLFGALDQLVPYLLGETPHFHVVVSFQQFPELAAPFAAALHRTPEQLLSEGFVLDDQQIDAQLSASQRSELSNASNALALFRPAGYSVTDANLLNSRLARHDGSSSGFDVARVRTWASRLRALRWAALAAVVLLVLLIGLLGGRRWWSRLAWAAAALLVASVVCYALTGPVYTSTIGTRMHTAVAEQQAKDAGDWQPLRDRALTQAQVVVDGIGTRMATTSRNWAIVSVLALAGAAVWATLDRRAPGSA